MEAAQLGVLMLGIWLFGTLIYSRASPLAGLGLARSGKAALMGFCVAATTSAFFAWSWWGVWMYFMAPCLGMLTAVAVYIRAAGPGKVYCAKVFHDLHSACPFPCRFQRLYRDPPP